MTGTKQDSSGFREPDETTALDYLELDLLWGDRGPVAQLRIRNSGQSEAIESLHLFAQDAGARREIGSDRVHVGAGETANVLIDLDRHFPTRDAWLQHDPHARPVRVWAGPRIDAPRIAAEVDF